MLLGVAGRMVVRAHGRWCSPKLKPMERILTPLLGAIFFSTLTHSTQREMIGREDDFLNAFASVGVEALTLPSPIARARNCPRASTATPYCIGYGI